MLTIYLVSAAVAGVLVLLSLFGAGHDVDHDVSVDHDLDHDTDHDAGHGDGIGHWIPFFSLRFYTYFFAGFGTTGLLLHYFTRTAAPLELLMSIAVGLFSGLGVWILVKLLRRSEASSTPLETDVLGKEGQVLVAIQGRNPGRIRCQVRGDIIDFLAVTEEETPLLPGDSVIVVAMEGARALVVPRGSIFSDDVLVQRIP